MSRQPGQRFDSLRAIRKALDLPLPSGRTLDELRTEGWLHNHTRMWFASIWIFTLRLPWPLGAALFEHHLKDADAASNTLSWRWVAGIQTPGKHYLARAENIARYTNGRFDPRGDLRRLRR